MFKITTSVDTYRYQDDVKFDNALKSIRHILSAGFEFGRIPVNQLDTKVLRTDEVLELSDAELFMIRACIDAAGYRGGGEQGLKAFWGQVYAGRLLQGADFTENVAE